MDSIDIGTTAANPNVVRFIPHSPLEVIVTDPRVLEFGLPAIQTEGSAGLDVRAFWPEDEVSRVILPNQQVMLDTGLRVWIRAPGMVGMLFPRSSSGVKGLVLGNGTGVIDSDYQGPLKLCLWNRGQDPIIVQNGDRVAQLVIMPCLTGYQIDVRDQFSDATARGEGGFGSTGVK